MRDGELFRIECKDRTGTHVYSVRLLHEFMRNGFMTPEKVRDLWIAASEHDVLFSEDTKGQFEPFATILLDPRSVWLEVVRETDEATVGVMYMTDVILGFDAQTHFAFWDGAAAGREPLALEGMKWAFERYRVMRLSCDIPPYQRGTIRFVKRIGFVQEGEKRGAILNREGKPMGLFMFGVLKDEFERIYHGGDAIREHGVGHSD